MRRYAWLMMIVGLLVMVRSGTASAATKPRTATSVKTLNVRTLKVKTMRVGSIIVSPTPSSSTSGGSSGGTSGSSGGTGAGTSGSAGGTDGGSPGDTSGTDGGSPGDTSGTDGGSPGDTSGTDAESSTGTDVVRIFPWAEDGGVSKNWRDGLFLFIVGFVGALATVFLFLGEFLPSMGGKADYDAVLGETEVLKKQRDEAIATRTRLLAAADVAGGDVAWRKEQLRGQEGLTQDLDTVIAREEKRSTTLKWRLGLLGMPMYLLLGGFFAAAFATNFLQALLFGFGWTAVAERIGLKRETEAKVQRKDEIVAALPDQAQQEMTSVRQTLEDKIREQKGVIAALSASLYGTKRENGTAGPGSAGSSAGGGPQGQTATQQPSGVPKEAETASPVGAGDDNIGAGGTAGAGAS
jgi:hypothetical protein